MNLVNLMGNVLDHICAASGASAGSDGCSLGTPVSRRRAAASPMGTEHLTVPGTLCLQRWTMVEQERVPPTFGLNYERLLDVPTLVIGNRHDTMNPAHLEWIAKTVSQGYYLFCSQDSHLAIYDDQKVYFEGLIQFIRDVDAEIDFDRVEVCVLEPSTL